MDSKSHTTGDLAAQKSLAEVKTWACNRIMHRRIDEIPLQGGDGYGGYLYVTQLFPGTDGGVSPPPRRPRPTSGKFQDWFDYLLGETGHWIQILNGIQFRLNNAYQSLPYGASNEEFNKKPETRAAVGEFEKGLAELAKVLNARPSDCELHWPPPDHHHCSFRVADFDVELVFCVDPDQQMVCNYALTMESIPASANTSSSSYLAASSSSGWP
jgi:hypothetical protein